MALTPGSRLGPYEVVSQIGQGGMGEVYAAADTRLDRMVAIKVLPAELASDPERRERFEREAKAIAALNHPHICTLHDVGHEDGTVFLVMEHLEGESLQDRLKRGKLPLDQALQIAIQIADALDKAHRQGITHRDLKPGNIFLVGSGAARQGSPQAKLLDFGLAKLSEPVRSARLQPSDQDSTKLADSLTAQGTILGTFHYMAPEQLEGKDADARSDIWAFGCVLYEMVTGRKAFEGTSQVSLIAAIMERDPPPLRVSMPLISPALDHAVGRCLAKDPAERWATARDLRAELSWVAEGHTEPPTAGDVATRTRRWRGVSLAAASILVLAFAVGWFARPVEQPHVASPARYAITLPETDELVPSNIAVSPDGEDLVYAGARDGVTQLFRRSRNQLDVVPIPGTEGASFPFFSPDGQQIGFFAENLLWRVPLAGGAPVSLCDAVGPPRGATWMSEDTIEFASSASTQLLHVSPLGGTPTPVTQTGDDRAGHYFPTALPDGHTLLFSDSQDNIGLVSLETGESRTLLPGRRPQYVASGHLVFERDGMLWAVGFDADRLAPTGPATPVGEGMRVAVWAGFLPLFTVSPMGSLVYVPPGALSESRPFRLVWVDREGQETPIPVQPNLYSEPQVSPDGGRVALMMPSQDNNDIWVYDLRKDSFTRLTFEPRTEAVPRWTPDGRHVAFHTHPEGQEGIGLKAADGTGSVNPLTASPNVQAPQAWTPDGSTLLFMESDPATGLDLYLLPRAAEGAKRVPRPLLQTSNLEADATLSPDGRWLAYASDEAGQVEVFVRPFPNVEDGQWQVSSGGGAAPRWGPEGRELFYRSGTAVMAVSVQQVPRFLSGPPHQLFDGPYREADDYDIDPSGQRFLMVKEAEPMADTSARAAIIVAENWVSELERLVPTN